jgi:transcription elongation factor Elf1
MPEISTKTSFGGEFDNVVECPWCESLETVVSSPFGGTVSEILFKCISCGQAFGFMKWDERFQEEEL